MNLTIPCPSCQRTLRVPESLLGQAVKCPSCLHTFTAPENVEEVPRRPAPPPEEPPSGRFAAPLHEEDYGDEPRSSKRRLSSSDDEDYEDAPRRRRGVEKPGKVQAISIMILVGGIIACSWFLIVNVMLFGFVSHGICCISGIYSLVLGIMAIPRGTQLLGEKAYRQPPPRGTAIMQIINIVNLDIFNLTLGILVLIFLSDKEVKDYFRS